MTREELREKVARALCYSDGGDKTDPDAVAYYYEHADAAIALVRDDTLEEAAVIFSRYQDDPFAAAVVADHLRKMKGKTT